MVGNWKSPVGCWWVSFPTRNMQPFFRNRDYSEIITRMIFWNRNWSKSDKKSLLDREHWCFLLFCHCILTSPHTCNNALKRLEKKILVKFQPFLPLSFDVGLLQLEKFSRIVHILRSISGTSSSVYCAFKRLTFLPKLDNEQWKHEVAHPLNMHSSIAFGSL